MKLYFCIMFLIFSHFTVSSNNLKIYKKTINQNDTILNEVHSFRILLIVNGKYQNINYLSAIRGNEKSKCQSVLTERGCLYFDAENYNLLQNSDSIEISFDYNNIKTSRYVKEIKLTVGNFTYKGSNGPLIYVYTSDLKTNRKKFGIKETKKIILSFVAHVFSGVSSIQHIQYKEIRFR